MHRPWSGPAGLVELHFRLFSGFGGHVFDDRRVHERTTLGTLDGRQVRWLSGEDEFLYLATHVANHGFLRISWLVDLERYLRFAPALDWRLMRERSREAGFEVPVTTALDVLERLLQVNLPRAAREAFPSSLVRRQLDARLFSGERVIDARWSNDPLASFLQTNDIVAVNSESIPTAKTRSRLMAEGSFNVLKLNQFGEIRC